MKLTFLFLSLCAAFSQLTAADAIVETALSPVLPDVISESTLPQIGLDKLVKGNKRYAAGQSTCPDRNTERRMAVSATQKPFAVIVGCSDSRVSPEIVFDQGIGDLFVVRVAGNVAGPLEIDSIEYAVGYLQASVIVVVGHQNCGAVSAVVNGQTAGIQAVASLIEPAVASVRGKEGDLLENAIKANVMWTVDMLKKSPKFAPLIKEKTLDIVGGFYHLETGLVEFI